MRLHARQHGVALSLAAVALVFSSITASAQTPPPSPRPPGPVMPRPGAVRLPNADTTKADTTKIQDLIEWTELDSTATALLAKPGYAATRYQGVRVRFDAKARTLYLEGEPAAVGCGVTLLVGDTIIYNDST